MFLPTSHKRDVIGWGLMTPLHQLKGVPQEVIRKAEGKQFVRLPTKVLLSDTDTSV